MCFICSLRLSASSCTNWMLLKPSLFESSNSLFTAHFWFWYRNLHVCWLACLEARFWGLWSVLPTALLWDQFTSLMHGYKMLKSYPEPVFPRPLACSHSWILFLAQKHFSVPKHYFTVGFLNDLDCLAFTVSPYHTSSYSFICTSEHNFT